jgi:hypothetical protein
VCQHVSTGVCVCMCERVPPRLNCGVCACMPPRLRCVGACRHVSTVVCVRACRHVSTSPASRASPPDTGLQALCLRKGVAACKQASCRTTRGRHMRRRGMRRRGVRRRESGRGVGLVCLSNYLSIQLSLHVPGELSWRIQEWLGCCNVGLLQQWSVVGQQPDCAFAAALVATLVALRKSLFRVSLPSLLSSPNAHPTHASLHPFPAHPFYWLIESVGALLQRPPLKQLHRQVIPFTKPRPALGWVPIIQCLGFRV